MGAYSSYFELNSIVVLSNGQILIGGYFSSYNGFSTNGFARLQANGAIDPTFNSGGVGFNSNIITNTVINKIAVQNDSKILVGGSFNTYNGVNRSGLVKLESNGTLDAAFSTSFSRINTIATRTDSKIWIAAAGGIYLLTSSGAIDPSFTPLNLLGPFSPTIDAILPISSNQLLIGGLFSSINGVSRNAIAKINTNGTLDTSFDLGYNTTISGGLSAPNIYSIQENVDGSIIFSGFFDNAITLGSNSVEKLTSTHLLDRTFNPINGARGNVNKFSFQADGKILITGNFRAYNGVDRSRLARITQNGELDNTYTVGTGLNNQANDIAIQTNGNIIAVGSFTSYNTTNVNRIVRTDANGAIDAAFATNIGTGANGEINTIALQTDGKIIIGGNFTSFNGNSSNYIARLNSNGTFDNTFNIGTGAFGLVRIVRIQTDGKLLLGGDFQFFNGATVGRIIRLNPDGTIDNTFNATGTGASGSVLDIQIASDGSIFVGGAFNTYNGQTNRPYIVKLTSTGVLDNSFSVNSILYPIANIDLYDNGKVLIVGTTSISTFYMQRLNSNRSVDNTFSVGSGTGSGSTLINKVQILGNGNKLLIAGPFTSFNGVGRNRIARLVDASITALPLTLQGFSGSLQNGNTQLNWHTSNEINTDQFIIERSLNNTSFNVVGTIVAKGNNTNTYEFTDFNTSNLGVTTLYYRLKMQDKNGSFTYSATVPIKLSLKTNITLLPNPVKNTAWLQIQQTSTEKINISVSDISGKIIMQQNPTITSGTTVIPLQVSQLAAGVYFVTIKGSNKNETLKLIKE